MQKIFSRATGSLNARRSFKFPDAIAEGFFLPKDARIDPFQMSAPERQKRADKNFGRIGKFFQFFKADS